MTKPRSIWIDEDKAELLEGCSSTELEKVDGSLRTASPVRLWRGGFLRPCSGPVTTEYGVSRTYNGVPREGYFHGGLDYGAPEGTPVISPADGRVVLVGEETDGFPYHGTCVTVDHGHGVTSLLMHLSASAVKTGDVVRAGQLVGAVGETGIATGRGDYSHTNISKPRPGPSLYLSSIPLSDCANRVYTSC